MREVVRHRVYAHPPERVWLGMTQPDGLARWLGITDLVAEEGRAFTLQVSGPLGRSLKIRGVVVTSEPPRRLELTWCHGSLDSRVCFELEPHPRGTRLTVCHRGLSRAQGVIVLLWALGGLERVPVTWPGLRWLAPVVLAGAGGIALSGAWSLPTGLVRGGQPPRGHTGSLASGGAPAAQRGAAPGAPSPLRWHRPPGPGEGRPARPDPGAIDPRPQGLGETPGSGGLDVAEAGPLGGRSLRAEVGSLPGAAVTAGALPGAAVTAGALPGAAVTAGALPGAAIVAEPLPDVVAEVVSLPGAAMAGALPDVVAEAGALSVGAGLVAPEPLERGRLSLVVGPRRPGASPPPDDVPERSPAGEQDPPRGVLRIQPQEPVSTLDPLAARTATDLILQDLVFERLYPIVDGRPSSSVVAAERLWPARDGLTIELRRDVTWHDGVRLSPADVCASLRAQIDQVDRVRRARWQARIAGCEVRGRTARIALRQPWSDPRLALDLPLIPAHHAAALAQRRWERFDVPPIGTGAFTGQLSRRSLRYTAAPSRAHAPGFAEIHVLPGGIDPALQIAGFVDGSVDVILGASSASLGALRAAGARLHPLEPAVRFVVLDPHDGATASPVVRRRLQEALTRETVPEVAPSAVVVVLGVAPGIEAQEALEIVNRWSAAGFRVISHPLPGDRAAGELSAGFDAILLEVRRLDHQHVLEPLVRAGPANPFRIDPQTIGLSVGGEVPGDRWHRIGQLLEAQGLVVRLSERDRWLAVAPGIEPGHVDPSRPLSALGSWRGQRAPGGP